MSTVEIGKIIPDLTLPATGGRDIRLRDLKGRHVVLYFYPKDSTPGCTTEGQDFRDLHPQFLQAGAELFGISRDHLKSHENFKAKQGFPFELLSDSEEEASRLFAVLKEKNMYGRITQGIERSTFLFDQSGVLRREWRKVKVAGHATEVLAAVRALNAPEKKS